MLRFFPASLSWLRIPKTNPWCRYYLSQW